MRIRYINGCDMALENKLDITGSADLARGEERIGKKKAAELLEGQRR